MASKTSDTRSAKSDAGGAGALRAETERLIAKERYKDAVKQAKLTYKEAATPEHHRLLERAYFLRARQLLQQGMRSSAVEVAQHLLDFGVTGADSPEELVRLLAGLGFEKAALALQDQLGAPGLKEQISQSVADQVVLHPERGRSASPELVRESGLVRKALEALQAGDEPGAMAMLRDLARSSPLSEWKYFVRGLAAFQRGDDAESRANWDRLESGRAAARIAGRLRRLSADATGSAGASLEAAERLAFGEPVLDRIRQLGSLVAGHEWDKALPLIGSLRQALHRIDPKLAERLTVVLIGSIIKAVHDMDEREAQALVDRFARVAQPMTIDPRWNRLRAMVWDGPHADPIGAIHYWTDYIEDLGTIPSLSPADLKLARALVWNHIAGLHREDVDALVDDEDGPPGFPGMPPKARKKPRRESREVVAAKKSVISAIERSLKLAPEHLHTYRMLVDVHHDWGDDKALEAAAQRLLARFPDDIETLQLLARHHYDRKDHRAALSYVQPARRVKPLDDSLRTLEWMTRVGLARQYAMEGKWDEGRAEFAAADELKPGETRDFYYLARKAMLEYKAGQAERGDRYVQEAKGVLVEPGPLWLAMLIESVRFQMPKGTIDNYAKLWDAELKKKRRSETAGEMAGLMTAFLASKTEYTGRAAHIKKVVAYLRKTTSLKYRRQDIEKVAEFLGHATPTERTLQKKLVQAGAKQHPDSVVLQMEAADVEILSMGFESMIFGRTPAGARKHLEAALKLAEVSTDPKETALLPIIRERLGALTEVTEAMGQFGPFAGGPFGPGHGGGPFGPGFLDMIGLEPDDDDIDDDEWDDDDIDDNTFAPPFELDAGPPPARAPKPAGRRAGSKKSKRRKK